MPPTGTIRVSAAKWFQDLNISNGTAPTNSDHGIEVPGARRGEYVHFWADKSNAAVYDLYGYRADIESWAVVETYRMSRAANEAEPMKGPTGFSRLASVRTDTNVQSGGHTNTWFGFGE
mgnify:CR=1 FL=1|jgi:hypothetical protein